MLTPHTPAWSMIHAVTRVIQKESSTLTERSGPIGALRSICMGLSSFYIEYYLNASGISI